MNKWINTIDELPKNNSLVLALTKEVGRWGKYIAYFAQIKNNKPTFYINGNPAKDIVYWQYFPETPKFQ